MKKFFVCLLICCLIVACFSLAGCGEEESGKIVVVATVYPEYEWLKSVVGENEDIELKLLLDSGSDLHSYTPSVVDIALISTCDLFVYVGGESDEWVEEVLATVGKRSGALSLLEILGEGAKEEEIVEGMQGEEEEEEEEEEKEYDEHVWLSLRNAAIFVDAFADALGKLDPAGKDTFAANATAYKKELNDLDEAFVAAVAEARIKTFLFADRFPFRYFADDYGLTYYAAFVGCSAESEASFETMVFLSKKVDELGLKAVCKIESSDGRIAQTVRGNTRTKDQEIVEFDSMQSATLASYAGKSYLSVMRNNLDALKRALA